MLSYMYIQCFVNILNRLRVPSKLSNTCLGAGCKAHIWWWCLGGGGGGGAGGGGADVQLHVQLD